MTLSPEVRQLAGHVADVLEITYVNHCPRAIGENCAITAISACAIRWDIADALKEAVRKFTGQQFIPAWSDKSGKETVVNTFREIAKD